LTGGFDLPSPHVHGVTARAGDTDAYGHVNNAVYLEWLDAAAWAHSAALGIPAEQCVAARRGMVVWRSQMHYLAPAFAGDALDVATWIVFADGRLRVDRRFQVRRPRDGRTLLRGLIHYVCADLDTGRPCRMPAEFRGRYRPSPGLAAALAGDVQRGFAPGVEPRVARGAAISRAAPARGGEGGPRRR
jgi:acyl-CoA thioester hydrolase